MRGGQLFVRALIYGAREQIRPQQVAINAWMAAFRARSNIWRARTDKAATGDVQRG